METIIINAYRKIFSRKIFTKFNFLLFMLSVRGLGVLNHENNVISGEKYLIKKILPETLKTNRPIFFDIGANVGEYCSTLLTYFPEAFIHAFEPHPKTYKSLKKRMTSKRVKTHNIGLGKSNEIMTLYDRADCDGSTHASLHGAVISEIHKQNLITYKVNIETLDEFTKKEGVDSIDYLKIDTEGNELEVLQGAYNLIKYFKIGCIQFEFNEMNVISKVFIRDFKKILYNYDLYRLLPNDLLQLNYSPLKTELFAYQNIVALPKNVI